MEKDGTQVNAKSLNSIAKLGVKVDDSIRILASGSDAAQVIDAFAALAKENFGESVDVVEDVVEEKAVEVVQVEGAISGIPVCDGIAIGRVVSLDSVMPEVPDRPFTSVDEELAAFVRALDTVCTEMKAQEAEAEKSLGKDQAGIFGAHLLMISDPDTLEKIKAEIRDGAIAEAALMKVMTALAHEYGASESEYMREREADVWDVAKQTMYAFDGAESATIELAENSVILAKDLAPAQTAQLGSFQSGGYLS